jgi:hypothetical protein
MSESILMNRRALLGGAVAAMAIDAAPAFGARADDAAKGADSVNLNPPAVRRGGSNITGSTISVVVGQQISLSASELNLPSGVSVTSRSWNVQGSRVNNYTISNASGSSIAFSDSGTASITFYWIASGTNTVTYTATLSDSSSITATATFTVTRPNPYSYTSMTTSISCCSGALSFGISWSADVITGSNEAGTVGWIQLVSPNRTKTLNDATVLTLSAPAQVLDNPPSGVIVCEQSFPASQEGLLGCGDGPSSATATSLTHISVGDSFYAYLMYQSSVSNSIWVTLGLLEWHWTAAASKDGAGVWTLDSGSSASVNPSGSGSNALPIWSDYLPNLSFH